MQENVINNTKDQGIAGIINFFIEYRINKTIECIAQQDINLEKAVEEIEKLRVFVSHPEHILGNYLQKHGEIAEHAQVRVMNALNFVRGLEPDYEIDSVARLDKADYLFKGRMVQSKFYRGIAGTDRAINIHLDKYPDYLDENGFFIIPKDHYEDFFAVYSKGESGALSSNADLRLYEAMKDWESVEGHKFFDSVKPSKFTYDEVQLDRIDETIKQSENEIHEIDQEKRKQIYEEGAPSVDEAIKVTAISAAIEGSVSFAMSVYQKKKKGKNIREFTANDWKEVGLDTGKGTLKGTIRGFSIYGMTNYLNTPAPIASGLITASFGMSGELLKLRKGNIDINEFIDNSEIICLDSGSSTVSAMLGQVIIPIPILGAIIGSAVGTLVLNFAKNYMSEEEQNFITMYYQDIENHQIYLNEVFKKQANEYIDKVKKYSVLRDLAFSDNMNDQLNSSIEYGRLSGVSDEDLLFTVKDIDAFYES